MFDYTDESDGTKRLFDLIPLFYENRKVSVTLIDEIDRSLHTNLTRKFLELFYRTDEKKDCQLIATTHDSNLLDLDLLRKDEIWFVERQNDHNSKVFSLNKFKERYQEDARILYKEAITRNIEKGRLMIENDYLKATQEGQYVLNDILIDFM